MSKKNILVFGSNGLVGSSCVRILSKSKKVSNVISSTRKDTNLFNYIETKNKILESKPDVVIFEGWCIGAKAQTNKQLKNPINSLERVHDQDIKWRSHVNNQLKTKYKTLFKQLDGLLYLKAQNFNILRKWRLKQERKLWIKSKIKSNSKIMSKGDVMNFMQTYQRITENMFRHVPKYASIILNLNTNHQIKSAIYKK